MAQDSKLSTDPHVTHSRQTGPALQLQEQDTRNIHRNSSQLGCSY